MAKSKSRWKTWKSERNGTWRDENGVITHASASFTSAEKATVNYGDNRSDFRKRIYYGDDATTPLFGTNYYLSRLPFSLVVHERGAASGGQQWSTFGRTHSSVSLPTAVNGSLVNQATTEAQIAFTKKVRKRTQGFAGGVFAGELLETVRLLASPTKRLRKEVGDLVQDVLRKKASAKRRKLKPASVRNLVADTWLEWSFGVKPLINDANDAANAFERLATGRNFDLLRVTAVGISRAYQNRPSGVTYPYIGAGFPGTISGGLGWNDICEVTYRGAIKSGNPSGDMPIPMQFGLDVSSIVPTAWELIPWSFMVDYFTNVGDVIDAWSIRFVDFSWLNRTIRNGRTAKMEGVRYNGGAALSGALSNFYVSGTMRQIDRATTTNQFSPSFTAQIPGFPSTKWLNIAALMNGIAEVKRR